MQNHKLKTVLKILDKLTRMLPFLFWTLLIFGLDEPYIAFLTLFAALLHESAHIGAAALIGGARVRARVFGFGLTPRRTLSYGEEALIAAAGPLVNIIAFILLIVFPFGQYLTVFALINLFTALSNLLPIKGYDGYRIISCVCERYEVEFPRLLAEGISTAITAAFCLLSLYAVSRLDTGYFALVSLLFLLVKSLSAPSKHILREKARK